MFSHALELSSPIPVVEISLDLIDRLDQRRLNGVAPAEEIGLQESVRV